MSHQPSAISHIEGRALPLRGDELDTDRIMPARFLRAVTFEGLERHLFEDDRAANPGHAFNDPRYTGASILVVNGNFGCGSSREHAVWALLDAGFRAVIAPRLADIFRSNALRNGLVPVEIDADSVERLVDATLRDPTTMIAIDVERSTVQAPGIRATFALDEFSRTRLLEGLDEIAVTLRQERDIAAFETKRPEWLPRVR